MFQSTLPRRERQDTLIIPGTNILFQSTLPRRERRKFTSCKYRNWRFNPRSREGSDAPCRYDLCTRRGVSIHAPAKGATAYSWIIFRRQPLFQSTLPRRERHSWKRSPGVLFRFQSTLPRRERLGGSLHVLAAGSFNPRSREGSDQSLRRWINLSRVSIHAPAKGATQRHLMPHHRQSVSIHAPAKGATNLIIAYAIFQAFQSTLPRRERLKSFCRFLHQHCFNPRSREGSDSNFSQKFILIFSRNQQIIILYT